MDMSSDTEKLANALIRVLNELDISEVHGDTSVIDFQALQRGVAELDQALMSIFEEYGPHELIVHEQITYAYARMPRWFFEKPPFHFGGYLQLSDKVSLVEDHLDTILWYKDRDPEEDEDEDVSFDSVFAAVEKMSQSRGTSAQAFPENILELGFDNMQRSPESPDQSTPAPPVQRSLEKKRR